MRKLLIVILCIVALVVCRSATGPPTVVPPTGKPPAGDSPRLPQMTALVSATAFIDGHRYDLSPHTPYSLLYMAGHVVFEYSEPVDASGTEGTEVLANNIIKLPLPSHATSIASPEGLRDKQGNVLDRISFPIQRYHGFQGYNAPLPTVTWESGVIREALRLGSYGNIVMPGEKIVFRWDVPVDKNSVVDRLSRQLAEISHDFTWLDDMTLVFAVKESKSNYVHLALNPDGPTPQWEFNVVRPQRLVVLDSTGKKLLSKDVPISTMHAIGMTDDYSHARLARSVHFGWLNLGVLEYQMDIATGALSVPVVHKEQRATLPILDWAAYTPGLSWGGSRVAVYGDGVITLTDVRTGDARSIRVNSVSSEGDIPSPYWIFWAHDDSKLFYNASSPDRLQHGIYVVDLSTGKEKLLAMNYHVLSMSPFSPHLYVSGSNNGITSWCIMDYSGKTIDLCKPGEYAVLAKWIDKDRALVNKSSSRNIHFPDGRCYIYHISEDRWEYIADGYGFDYDANSGRIFLLQERP